MWKTTAVINWSRVKQRLDFEFKRIKQQGTVHIFLKAVGKIASIVLWVFLLPITCLLHLAGYRRVTVFTERIGHLAIEPDCLLKEQALGQIPKRKWIMLTPPGRVANEHLLSYWQPYFIIIRHPILCYLIQSMSKWILMRDDISHYILAINKAQAAYRIYSEWGNKSPILKLNQEDEKWAAIKLIELGLPKDAWFVCVHVREPGFSPIDEELHSHRNASIKNTIPAMKEIIRRGGWVIRIGDPTMTPLEKIPNVIDYAHHPMKSARMDIILCAKTRFLLGNTSGIALVSSVFGVPCALANTTPVSAFGVGVQDITLHKRLWSTELNRYLNFSETIDSPISNFIYASQFRKLNIRLEENNSIDLKQLVHETFLLIGSPKQSMPKSQLKQASMLLPHQYGYGGTNNILHPSTSPNHS
jgi:putative glycosyltransferase (TIGR04372 family)